MPLSWSALQFLAVLVITAFFGSLLASRLMLWLAVKQNIVDDPLSKPERKKQTRPIPLLGGSGFALIAAFLMGLVWLVNKFDWWGLQAEIGRNLDSFKLIWVLTAIIILILGGYVDDKYKVSSKIQLIFVNLAILLTIFAGGVTIESLSYPFNQYLPDIPYLPHLLAYFWLLFCVGATKFLDGHDGLVSTVGIIGLLSIASVAMFANVDQPLIFLFALIWISSIIGFLPFNFPHAKMYLGEGGSEIVGFIIGVLAILSGAKIATASAVIGWFIIDLLFVWLLRVLNKRNPFSVGDRRHWHFRLVDLGLNKISVLAATTLIMLITAHSGLLLDTIHKPYLLASQVVFLVVIFSLTEIVRLKKQNKDLVID
jgi:UDP-GlcNAc:undecaprenyl-phosphate/decaprenyl-phosphate GlcNAc-1-phosphate transferase